MKNLRMISVVGLPMLLASGALTGCATVQQRASAENAAFAQRLAVAHQNAIVSVTGTLKVTTTVKGLGASQQNETPVKAAATVVDDSGLVVTCSLLLDPIGSVMRGPLHVQHGEQSFEIEMKTHLEGLRILLADKTEVPARVVLKDEDLGLVVLAAEPKAGVKAPLFSALPLTGETSATLFAPLYVLGRTGESFQRVPYVARGIAVNRLEKPRLKWVFMAQTMPLGLPVFAADGRWVGLGAVDFRPPDMEHPESMEKFRPLPIVLPATDIRDLVERAKVAVAKSGPSVKVPAKVESARTIVPQAGPATATEMPAELARTLIATKQDAVVMLRGSLKFTDGHSPQVREEEIECIATVLDKTGLAVCGSAGKATERKYQEQHLNYVLRDGTEVPARIILQDDDLELTVVAPALKPGAKLPVLPALDLETGVKAALFDDVLLLSRLDRDHHYTVTADTGKITACITRPRTFYLRDGNPGGSNVLGTPVLLADGRLLGVIGMVPKQLRARRNPGPFQTDISVEEEALRVVPAAALADLMEQARKVMAKKPAADKKN